MAACCPALLEAGPFLCALGLPPPLTQHAPPLKTTRTHSQTLATCPPGASVTSGQPLFILEAMKMEHVVKAPFAGVVVKLTSRPGDIVEDGRALASVQRK